jgi:flagellar hook assembly protein FlgD
VCSSDLNAPGVYPITFKVDGELIADNYTAVFDDGLTLIVFDPSETSNKKQYIRDNRQGIIIRKNPALTSAEFEIRTLEDAEVKITVLDNVGNLVFFESGIKTKSNAANVRWNLQNSAGRSVADGSYLVIAEAKGLSGKVYKYWEKLGVKK